MHIVELAVTFQLPGCDSLKEKRRRLRSLADRFGRDNHTAVCESGFHDHWGRAEWRFLVIGNAMPAIERQCQRIEEHCHGLDAYITDLQRENLC